MRYLYSNHIDALSLISQGGKSAEQGIKIIFDSFYPHFKRKFLRAGVPFPQAEELANESMSKIFHSLLSKTASIVDPIAFPAWAFTIANNTMLDYFRKTKEQTTYEIAMDDQNDAHNENVLLKCSIDYSNVDSMTHLCFMQQLKNFYKDYPERASLLERIICEDEGVAEISKVLGRTLGATREYISQCKKHLYKYLRECIL